MGNSAGRDVKRVAQAEQEKRVLELRIEGHSYEEIAKRVGLAGKTGAWTVARRAIRRIPEDQANEARRLEVARLDRLLSGVFSKARGGDIKAIGAVLSLMDRRASLLGLDAPKTTNHVVVQRELERVLNRLEQTLEPEVYAQVLRAIAAEVGGEAASPNGGGEEGEDHGGGEGEGG
jgi:hypothetical protein